MLALAWLNNVAGFVAVGVICGLLVWAFIAGSHTDDPED